MELLTGCDQSSTLRCCCDTLLAYWNRAVQTACLYLIGICSISSLYCSAPKKVSVRSFTLLLFLYLLRKKRKRKEKKTFRAPNSGVSPGTRILRQSKTWTWAIKESALSALILCTQRIILSPSPVRCVSSPVVAKHLYFSHISCLYKNWYNSTRTLLGALLSKQALIPSFYLEQPLLEQ